MLKGTWESLREEKQINNDIHDYNKLRLFQQVLSGLFFNKNLMLYNKTLEEKIYFLTEIISCVRIVIIND